MDLPDFCYKCVFSLSQVQDFFDGKTTRELVASGTEFAVRETKKYFREEFFKDYFNTLPVSGSTRIEWCFDREDSIKDEWVHTADSDWGEGYSRCSLER